MLWSKGAAAQLNHMGIERVWKVGLPCNNSSFISPVFCFVTGQSWWQAWFKGLSVQVVTLPLWSLLCHLLNCPLYSMSAVKSQAVPGEQHFKCRTCEKGLLSHSRFLLICHCSAALGSAQCWIHSTNTALRARFNVIFPTAFAALSKSYSTRTVYI